MEMRLKLINELNSSEHSLHSCLNGISSNESKNIFCLKKNYLKMFGKNIRISVFIGMTKTFYVNPTDIKISFANYLNTFLNSNEFL